MHEHEAKEALTQCLLTAVQGSARAKPDQDQQQLKQWAFFNSWFRTHGNAFCFVFRENFWRTNIQAGELLALIEAHTRSVGQNRGTSQLQFHTSRDFLKVVHAVAEQMKLADLRDDFLKEAIASVVEHQWLHFSHSVIADFRYGSCQVFLPPNLSLDLARICAESGYVYSCGRLIYVRNIGKTNRQELEFNLKRHLHLTKASHYELLFHVNASSAPSADPRARSMARSDFADGDLSTLVVHLDKAYFDGAPLSQLPILLQPPVSTSAGASPSTRRSLWVFCDQNVQFYSTAHQGEERYIVVFDEEHVKYSPFFLFDENKPGWLAPVTIPHTLYAAMINITKPWPSGEIALADPFCGTATAAFESWTNPQVRFSGADLDPVLVQVLHFNKSFFACDDTDFCAYYEFLHRAAAVESRKTLEKYPDYVQDMREKLTTSSATRKLRAEVSKAIEGADQLLSTYESLEPDSAEQRERFAEDFSKAPSVMKLAFFVFLRASRHVDENTHKGLLETRRRACAEELRRQVEAFGRWRLLAQKQEPVAASGTFQSDLLDSRPVIFIAYRRMTKLTQDGHGSRIEFGRVGDVREKAILGERSCDLIITDPPYGFNDPKQTHQLAELYVDAIGAFIDALKPQGHLVICLPSNSYLGKPLPYCTSSTLITKQVIATAATRDRRVIVPARSLPFPRALYSEPYYWRSDRALKRQVLHFRIW